MLFYRAKARKERQHSSCSAGSPAGTGSTDMVQVKPRHSLCCCFSLWCYTGKLGGSGQQRKDEHHPSALNHHQTHNAEPRQAIAHLSSAGSGTQGAASRARPGLQWTEDAARAASRLPWRC